MGRLQKQTFEESFEMTRPQRASVVKGEVIRDRSGPSIIDVGYKEEGPRRGWKEFAEPWRKASKVEVGDEVECSCVQGKTRAGELLSPVRWRVAKKLGTVWKKPCRRRSGFEGAIFGRVKGGVYR